MAESKLAMYQLAAADPISTITAGIQPPTNPLTGVKPSVTYTKSNPATAGTNVATKQNWFQRNNINFNTVVEGFGALLNIAGGAVNVRNAYENNQILDLNGRAASEQERQLLYQIAMASQNGGMSNEMMMQMFMQNQQLMMQMLSKAGIEKDDDKKDKKSEDNLPLYIGLGVGGLVLVAIIVAVAMKK